MRNDLLVAHSFDIIPALSYGFSVVGGVPSFCAKMGANKKRSDSKQIQVEVRTPHYLIGPAASYPIKDGWSPPRSPALDGRYAHPKTAACRRSVRYLARTSGAPPAPVHCDRSHLSPWTQGPHCSARAERSADGCRVLPTHVKVAPAQGAKTS